MSDKKPLLHILVIGFHHKKGCQVEFSYPPIISGSDDGNNECPSGWKYLPTLALPDGSHNFERDSVFFNLPSLDDQNESIYGVSCYRQIPVEKLKIRTADVTRSTVQKSVCALISVPIYGYIEVKLSLIADAFFDQGDFESVKILIDAYNQVNACLMSNDEILIKSSKIKSKHIYVVLNIRDLILKWRHKILILFKLFLLQKRVICFGSPVRPMCSLILGISSLHSLLIENGFHQVACVKTSRPMSPMPDFTATETTDDNNIVKNISNDNLTITTNSSTTSDSISIENNNDNCSDNTQIEKCNNQENNSDSNNDESIVDVEVKEKSFQKQNSSSSTNELELGKRSDKSSLPRDVSVDALASTSLAPLCALKPSTWNAPIPIFQHGNLCLPYLSLPYMDLLTDSSVLGYIIGTSNILFQQKKQLADVLINVDAAIMETQDHELRKQLQLTTEDLRFIDFIIRHATNPKEDAEGSEAWIREQFQGYMVAMLKTSLFNDNCKEIEHFNGSFIIAWKKTQCFQEWFEKRPDDSIFESIPMGHPFAGTLSVADMKLRIAQTMQNTESGRKLNQAVNNTSKAVGGALSTAKGAFSNWWSSITTSPPILQNSQSTEEEPSVIKNSSSHTQLCENNDQQVNIIVADEGLEEDKNVEKICVNNEQVNYSQKNSKTDENILKTNKKTIELAEEAENFDSNRHIFTV